MMVIATAGVGRSNSCYLAKAGFGENSPKNNTQFVYNNSIMFSYIQTGEETVIVHRTFVSPISRDLYDIHVTIDWTLKIRRTMKTAK